MKFYKKLNQPGYLVLSDVKIRSFPHIWNPKDVNIVTEEHLKRFLEKAFPHNFLFYIGDWLGFFLDEKCFTPFAYRYVVDVSTTLEYLFEKEEGETGVDISYREDLYPYIIFIFDVSHIYKIFSHLISEENFSFLLRKQFYELRIHPAWHTENLIVCKFFSSKVTLNRFFQGKDEWFPKDKDYWHKVFSSETLRLEKSRRKLRDCSKAMLRSPQIKIENLEEYLKK